MFDRRVGHVPFKSLTHSSDKGGYIATTTINGLDYVSHGDTERLATMNLRSEVEGKASKGKLNVKA